MLLVEAVRETAGRRLLHQAVSQQLLRAQQLPPVLARNRCKGGQGCDFGLCVSKMFDECNRGVACLLTLPVYPCVVVPSLALCPQTSGDQFSSCSCRIFPNNSCFADGFSGLF